MNEERVVVQRKHAEYVIFQKPRYRFIIRNVLDLLLHFQQARIPYINIAHGL